MSRRLLHAQHNEIVCHSLCTNIENADWVVTTAFYSALHFLEHKLFPYKYKSATGTDVPIKTFDDYYNFFHIKSKTSKHQVRENLAKDHCKEIAAHYVWLKSTCWTARYYDYKFPRPQSAIEEAKRRLREIKQFCENNQ